MRNKCFSNDQIVGKALHGTALAFTLDTISIIYSSQNISTRCPFQLPIRYVPRGTIISRLGKNFSQQLENNWLFTI